MIDITTENICLKYSNWCYTDENNNCLRDIRNNHLK